jgi:hypothetical protein
MLFAASLLQHNLSRINGMPDFVLRVWIFNGKTKPARTASALRQKGTPGKTNPKAIFT